MRRNKAEIGRKPIVRNVMCEAMRSSRMGRPVKAQRLKVDIYSCVNEITAILK